MSHGWSRLPIFEIDRSRRGFSFCVKRDGKFHTISIQTRNQGILAQCSTSNHSRLSPGELRIICSEVLSTDIDFSDFWSLCQKSKRLAWVAKERAGPFLRCPSIFEDVITLICTINCNWRRAVSNITALSRITAGSPALPSLPAPYDILALDESGLRKLGLGYRARYLTGIAEAALRDSFPTRHSLRNRNPEEARKELLELPGVGPYVAETLLRISGVFDFFGLDSWNRKQVLAGQNGDPTLLEKEYARFGRWRGLAFWMDATARWYRRQTDWP